MPEWNLVRVRHTNFRFVIMVVVLTIVSVQLGCSKLRQSPFSRELVDGRNSQPKWSSDASDSASRYVSDPYVDLNAAEQKDEARIVGIGDGNSGDGEVKLVASQPPYSLGKTNNDSASSVNDLFCEHTAECDCHKPKVKPKLPFAEPIDPPPAARKTPPSGLINQPLTPILFSAGSRQKQSATAEDTNNSLRRNEQWSHEKVATLTNKQNSIDLASIDPNLDQANPVRLNPSQDQTSQLMLASDLSRDFVEPKTGQTHGSDLESPAPRICLTCRDSICDGTCASRTKRTATTDLRPVVDSEPIVIVATTSTNTIPPFADCPPDDDTIDLSTELEIVMPKPTIPTEMPVVSAETEIESFDDLSDDDWLAMFGPLNANGQPCLDCESNECQDASCQTQADTEITASELAGEPEMTQMSNLVVTVSEDASSPAPSTDTVQLETNIAQASPIASISAPESNNDFQPVAHTTDVGKIEIEIEHPTWGQRQPPVEPVIETPVSEIQPTADAKTVELPLLDLGPVSVPDASKVLPAAAGVRMMPRQPQRYRGPPVRFEIIDNTVPWDVKLSETIQNVKSQLAVENEPTTRNGLEVNLRLLEVLQRQMADVEVRNDSRSDEEKQYWQHQLDAITLMLNSNDSDASDLARHNKAIHTLDHLRKAVERLESIADLRISNCAFCTEVSGFGQFKTFPSTTFAPTQPLLVYCEVENYASMERQVNLNTEVHTRLRGSYVIYDQQGRAVQQAEYPIVEDIARKRRRDFYLHFPIQLENLPPGAYKLDLLVEDLNGNKTDSVKPGMEFQVR